MIIKAETTTNIMIIGSNHHNFFFQRNLSKSENKVREAIIIVF